MFFLLAHHAQNTRLRLLLQTLKRMSAVCYLIGAQTLKQRIQFVGDHFQFVLKGLAGQA